MGLIFPRDAYSRLARVKSEIEAGVADPAGAGRRVNRGRAAFTGRARYFLRKEGAVRSPGFTYARRGSRKGDHRCDGVYRG